MEVRKRVAPPGEARERAYAALLDRRALDAAYRYATLILGDRGDAEDATHDAALTAWRKLADLRDPERFDAWFGRILVNACRDRLRARRRLWRPAGDPVPSWETSRAAGGTIAGGRDVSPGLPAAFETDPAEVIARRETLGAALQSLSGEHREVIVLRFWADLTVDQIAERTHTRTGTVKSRLHYALRELRAAIGAHGDGGHDR